MEGVIRLYGSSRPVEPYCAAPQHGSSTQSRKICPSIDYVYPVPIAIGDGADVAAAE